MVFIFTRLLVFFFINLWSFGSGNPKHRRVSKYTRVGIPSEHCYETQLAALFRDKRPAPSALEAGKVRGFNLIS